MPLPGDQPAPLTVPGNRDADRHPRGIAAQVLENARLIALGQRRLELPEHLRRGVAAAQLQVDLLAVELELQERGDDAVVGRLAADLDSERRGAGLQRGVVLEHLQLEEIGGSVCCRGRRMGTRDAGHETLRWFARNFAQWRGEVQRFAGDHSTCSGSPALIFSATRADASSVRA
jgi:hypothetical protein